VTPLFTLLSISLDYSFMDCMHLLHSCTFLHVKCTVKLVGSFFNCVEQKQSLSKHWDKPRKNVKHRCICTCISQINILFNRISRWNNTVDLQCIPVSFITNFCTIGPNIWLRKLASILYKLNRCGAIHLQSNVCNLL